MGRSSVLCALCPLLSRLTTDICFSPLYSLMISSCSVPLPKEDVCWLAPPSSGFPRACMESATARLFGDTGEQRHTLLARATEGGGGGSGIVFTGKSDTRSRLD